MTHAPCGVLSVLGCSTILELDEDDFVLQPTATSTGVGDRSTRA